MWAIVAILHATNCESLSLLMLATLHRNYKSIDKVANFPASCGSLLDSFLPACLPFAVHPEEELERPLTQPLHLQDSTLPY